MRLASLAISLLVHAALIAWAFFSMAATPELKPAEPEPITVAIITPSELLRLKKGSETSKELEAKAKEEPKPEQSKVEAEKPKPITAPEPPAAPPAPPDPPKPVEEAKPKEAPPPEPPKAADPIAEKLAGLPPEPLPGPNPDELKKLEEEKRAVEEKAKAEEQKKAEEEKKKADEKKKAEDKKKAEEKKKADEKKKLAEKKRREEEEKKKKQAAADRLAALLDKDPTKKGAPLSATPPTTDTNYTGPTAGTREGNDTVLSVREQDILKGQITQQLRGCWKLPGGGGGIETTVVTLRWKLRPDGSLDGEPVIDQPQSAPVFQIAAEAAIRAVKSCSPFTLPADKYAAWKSIIWDFDPREML